MRFLAFFISILLCSCGGLKSTTTNQYCNISSDKYYVSKIIDKSTYKNESVTASEKTSLKKDLIKQISEKISLVSRLNEQVVEQGEIGSYSSYLNNESIVSSVGSVNNPKFIYCKSGRKYYLHCTVSIENFEVDLYNQVNARVKIFGEKLDLALRPSKYKRDYTYDDLKKFNDTNLFLANAVELIAFSRYISEEDKSRIINDVALVNGKYFNLESKSNLYFDIQIEQLNQLLISDDFEKIHLELISLSKKQFNPSQRERLLIFKNGYEKKLETKIIELDSKIEKAIKYRQNDDKTKELLSEYASTLFYKNQREKYDLYKRQISKRSGYARNALRFGFNAGSSFNYLNKSTNTINVDQFENNLNFENILPSYELSLIHNFFNPRKRFGVSINYKSFSENLIQLSDTDFVSNSINDFNSIQFGLSYGPFEIKHGSIEGGSDFDESLLTSFIISILRTDKIAGSFGKSNSINLSLFGDYISNFDDSSLYSVGVSMNYNLSFNRTPKY